MEVSIRSEHEKQICGEAVDSLWIRRKAIVPRGVDSDLGDIKVSCRAQPRQNLR